MNDHCMTVVLLAGKVRTQRHIYSTPYTNIRPTQCII